MLAQPTVKGSARPGQVLTIGQPGVRPEPARAIEWLRGGKVVKGATGPRYRLTAADLGQRVGVRVRLTRPGYDTLTTRTSWSSVVRSRPVIKVTAQPGTGRLAVTAKVTASGVPSLDGVIRVRSRGKLLKQIVLRDGVAKGTVTGLATRDADLPLPGAGHDQGVVRRGGAQDQDRLSGLELVSESGARVRVNLRE